MQLVLLAAGHGRRFGGLKQLAPVGPRGEALIDYTARDALACGFDGVVLVVREEIRRELADHARRRFPRALAIALAVQGPLAGTAAALAAAGPFLDGAFGVANADDHYGPGGLACLADELASLAGTHMLVSYRLADTLLTDAPVTRGVLRVGADGDLEGIAEMRVERDARGGLVGSPVLSGQPPSGDLAAPSSVALSGAEPVSMNLWGFDPSILAEIEVALERFAARRRAEGGAPGAFEAPPELLLPEVIGSLVERGAARVAVRPASGRCIGITHPGDLPLVRALIESERHTTGRRPAAPRRLGPADRALRRG